MPIQIDLGSSSPRPTAQGRGLIVGIDLGTTNSLVAYVRDGKPEVLSGDDGQKLLPSVIELDAAGDVATIGSAAKSLRAERPGQVIYSVKRLMGRTLADIPVELRRQIPYELVDDVASHQVRIKVGERALSPVEISSKILRNLKERAEKALGQKVDRAVITVPAYFDDAQRTATKAAGRLAGLEVLRVFNEPTAAALGYGWSFDRPGTVAIFDLGGGTFDVSILRIDTTVLEVLATAGDTQLGGDDFDRVLADAAWANLDAQMKTSGVSLQTLSADSVQRLRAAILAASEEAKIELTNSASAEIAYSQKILGVAITPFVVTRAQAELLWEPLVARALDCCRSALADAKLATSDLDDVLLVGGSTRVPFVQRKVAEFFGRPPNTRLHPDEAVAIGAAVQADTLSGSHSNRLLLDVIPLSLGIETVGGAVAKLIPRNSTIPTEARDVYTNHAENQTAFDIHVLQGERELVKDCRSLARFKLRGLQPAPPGFHRVEVVFRIDASGILAVRAKDLRSGEAREIEVRPSFGLREDELFALLEQAEAHAQEDAEARELVEARVEAEGVIRATEKTLESSAHLVDAHEIAEIRARLVDLKNASTGSSPAAVRKALAELDSVARELAELQVNEALGLALRGKAPV